MLDEGRQFVLKVFEPLQPCERFVETEERHDGGGLDNGQPLVGLRVVANPKVAIDLRVKGCGAGKRPWVIVSRLGTEARCVSRKTHVAEGQLQVGEASVEGRLEVVVVLHPLCECVADEDQRLTLPQFEGQRGGRRGSREWSGLMVGRPLLVDLLLLERSDRGEHVDCLAAPRSLVCDCNLRSQPGSARKQNQQRDVGRNGRQRSPHRVAFILEGGSSHAAHVRHECSVRPVAAARLAKHENLSVC